MLARLLPKRAETRLSDFGGRFVVLMGGNWWEAVRKREGTRGFLYPVLLVILMQGLWRALLSSCRLGAPAGFLVSSLVDHNIGLAVTSYGQEPGIDSSM